MRRRWLILLLLPVLVALGGAVTPLSSDAQTLRILLAKQFSTAKWFARVDSSSRKTEAEFRAEVSRQFNVAASDVQVLIRQGTEADRQAAVTALASGLFEGAGVVATTTAPAEQSDELRMALGTIFAGTGAQKRARWVDVLEKYPAAVSMLTLLRGTLTPDAKATMLEISTRLCQKVGSGATEVLTSTEYDNYRSLAVRRGFGALVPTRPGCS